jgi:hypothetical protein
MNERSRFYGICKTTRASSACPCPSLSPLAPDSLLRGSPCSPCLPAHFTRLPNKAPNYDEWLFPCQLARSLASRFGRPGQQANNNVPIPPLFSNRVMSVSRSGDRFRAVLVVGLHIYTLIVVLHREREIFKRYTIIVPSPCLD